ncbi:MAG: hypothetical protein RIQ89_1654 [Bacteroidota bacterium]
MKLSYLKTFLFIAISESFLFLSTAAQTPFWVEDFNNNCTTNCLATNYTGGNGSWTVVSNGTNGSNANEWFISCAENGQSLGQCGAGCGNNATLHIGNVPCTLCFFCPNGDCGAAYNAGPTLLGEDPTTHKICASPSISTIGQSGITLDFNYIENGQSTIDNGTLLYSIDNGTNWILLSDIAKTNTCPNGNGLWTLGSITLPSVCENIATLKIGFEWINDADGNGTDPSFAIDNVSLSSSSLGTPVALFTADTTRGCPSTCFNFTDQSSGAPTQWEWLFTGANPSTSSLQNPTNICYPNPGIYTVKLIASNSFGSDTLNLINYVNIDTLPSVSFSTSSQNICANDCIQFTAITSSNTTNWDWTFTSSNTPSYNGQNPPPICYSNAGTYSASLTINNGFCSNTFTLLNSINVLPCNLPSASFTTNDSVICFGDCVNFIDQSAGALGWQWIFMGAVPTQSTIQNPSFVCYLDSGSYDVTLIVNNSNGYDTLTIQNYITVLPVEIPIVTANGTLLTSTPAATYQWYSIQSGIITGATQQNYQATTTGNYYVTITTVDGCFSQSAAIPVMFNDINEATLEGINVSPLPVNDELNISLMKNDEYEFIIYDQFGRIILNLKEKQRFITIDMKYFENGLYYLSVSNKSFRTVMAIPVVH